jgi:hypothetical protein
MNAAPTLVSIALGFFGSVVNRSAVFLPDEPLAGF